MTPRIYSQRDIKRKQEKFLEKKRNLKIGIYGSFDPDYISHISSLKETLISEGYEGTRISEDTQIDLGAVPADDRDAINLEHSRALLKESRVHIFIFFNEDQDHPKLMQSATMELTGLYFSISEGIKNTEQFILILMESGYKDTCNTLFKGVLDDVRVPKMVYPFSNPKRIISIAKSFCFNCILHENTKE